MCTFLHSPAAPAAAAGYCYSNPETQEERDLYFYHPDHLGSTSYVIANSYDVCCQFIKKFESFTAVPSVG